MSESVSILIKADDQASRPIVNAANTFEKSQQRINAVAVKAGTSYKEMGGRAKSATEFVGTLANVSGSPAIAGLAGQLAQITEKTSQFSEVSKAGGAGALAFRLGLLGLAGVLVYKVGKSIYDVVFQTEKLKESFEKGRIRAREFSQELSALRAKEFAEQVEGFELIRDPEKKQSQYRQLFSSVGEDLRIVNEQLEAANRSLREYEEGRAITANLNGFQLDIPLPFGMPGDADMEARTQDRVEALKEEQRQLQQQKDQIEKTQRAQTNASTNYVANLREENEYLKANREEQIKLDAARNATAQDRGEAERLLRERDAILAKVDAEKKLEDQRKKAEDAARRRAQDKAKEFEDDIKHVADVVKAEEDRLKLMRIEMEQGKEAAKVAELMMKGVSEETAKRLAAEEAKLEKRQSGGDFETSVAATQGRLLTRGLVRKLTPEKALEEILRFTKMQFESQTKESDRKAAADAAAASAYRETKEAIERKGEIMFARPPV